MNEMYAAATTRVHATPHATTANQHPTQPPAHPPTTPTPQPGGPAKHSRAPKLVAAAVALAVVAGAGTALTRLDPFGPQNQFQTIAYAGESPFTSPVGTDRPGMVPVAAGGEQPSDTGEMYAANPDAPACDGAALLAQLQADPAKATAWTQVLGITPDGLTPFVQSLTPVLLHADTAVIDYGYRNGAYVAAPAVLAAGTAVFINSYGEPTVKCFSGNPLTRGESSDPKVAVVTASPRPITTNVFTNVVTGTRITSPGKPDPKPNPGPSPRPTINLVVQAQKARLAADQARVLANAATNQRIAAEWTHEANVNAAAQAEWTLAYENIRLAGWQEVLAAAWDAAAKAIIQAQIDAEAPRRDAAAKDRDAANQKRDASQKELDKAKDRETNLEKDAKKKEEAAKQKEKKAGIQSPAPWFAHGEQALDGQDGQARQVAKPDTGENTGIAGQPDPKDGKKVTPAEEGANTSPKDPKEKPNKVPMTEPGTGGTGTTTGSTTGTGTTPGTGDTTGGTTGPGGTG